MDEDIVKLESGDYKAAGIVINKFVQNFSQKFNLQGISSNWTKLWAAAFQYLGQVEAKDIHLSCISTVRILSRDKTYLDQVVEEKQINLLLQFANIGGSNLAQQQHQSVPPDTLIVEALKCLCNLVFNSNECQNLFGRNNAAEGIIRRIRTYKNEDVKYEIQFFDMKLLFLVTALNTEVRAKVRDDLHGLTYLTEVVDLQLHDCRDDATMWLDDREIDLLCEILKVLFNLQAPADADLVGSGDDEQEEQEIQFRRLAGVLRDAFIRGGKSTTTNREKRQELISNLVNLMSSMPTASLIEFAPAATGQAEGSHGESFEGRDVVVLDLLLAHLKGNLEVASNKSPIIAIERLGPILTVLIKCCRCHRVMRRYIRQTILPPLRDVMTRPEEGTEIRNYLCRLLTSPEVQVRDLVAELLFIACKENVSRMAKHTGYGNAMGMFANRGLLASTVSNDNKVCGGDGPLVRRSQDYSSDSEDSDTEEYKEMQHGINPVLGCYEPPRPNPFEGMSEEQKEYEAMKLVNLIDQLDRHGIMRPARIGANGKPEPVDHILQLQEDLATAPKDHHNNAKQ